MNVCPVSPKSFGKSDTHLYIMNENVCDSFRSILHHFANKYTAMRLCWLKDVMVLRYFKILNKQNPPHENNKLSKSSNTITLS